MKKSISFFSFVISVMFSYSQCEAPLVVNWHAENDSTFTIEFVASENSSEYIINFIVLYNENSSPPNNIHSYSGPIESGLNTISHNPMSDFSNTINNIETYYYKVEIGTVCDNETIWGDDFYMSRNSLLNNDVYQCNENLIAPITLIPDNLGMLNEFSFEIENEDTPLQIDELSFFIDIGHTFISDICISLTSPGGTTIVLLESLSIAQGSAHDLSVFFEDGAEEIIATQNEISGFSVHGTYAPYESFEAFIGETLSGTWTLTIFDAQGGDYGYIFGFCLNAETSPCYSSISGQAYFDNNSNNTFDTDEFPLEYGTVNIMEDVYRVTNNEGNYSQCFQMGEYTTQLINLPQYYTSSPDYYDFETNEGEYLEGFDFALQPIPGINDLAVDLYHVTPDRPGFENTYYVNYTNIGTECIDNISLLFTANDEFVEIIDIESEVTTTIAGAIFTADIGILCPNESGSIVVTILVNETTELGTLLNTTAVISPLDGDENLIDNYGHDNSEVVGSFDPNDITVNHPAINSEFIVEEDRLEYVIRFQNTGTYYAENVLVTNTIEEDLILTSIEILNSSHEVEIEIVNGVIHFDFSNIILPASEDDYEGSQGYVRYSIQPTSDFSFNDVIENSAEIYFDFNEAIITNTATTVLDETIDVFELSNEAFSIYPNPSSGKIFIDSPLTNKIEKYEIYTILGELIISHSLQKSNEVSIESLLEGLYTIKILDINQTVIGSYKFVKKQ